MTLGYNTGNNTKEVLSLYDFSNSSVASSETNVNIANLSENNSGFNRDKDKYLSKLPLMLRAILFLELFRDSTVTKVQMSFTTPSSNWGGQLA